MKKNKKIVGLVILVVVIAFASFFVGYKCASSKKPSFSQSTFGQHGMNGNNPGMKGNGGFGGLTVGEILSKDAQSITLKLRDGGSRIIFFTDKVVVQKMTDGSVADLVVGKQISVTGTTNPDGSINAQSVQIRPSAMPAVQ